jgi:hypothetical protein
MRKPRSIATRSCRASISGSKLLDAPALDTDQLVVMPALVQLKDCLAALEVMALSQSHLARTS